MIECLICMATKPGCEMAMVPCRHSGQICFACVAKISQCKCPYRCPDVWPPQVQEEAALATLLQYGATVAAAVDGVVSELKMRGWWAGADDAPRPPAEFAADVEWRADGASDGDGEWVLREGGECGPPTRYICLANALRKARQLSSSMQDKVNTLMQKADMFA